MSWTTDNYTLIINLAKTDNYILEQKSMLHPFPLINTTRLNPPTNTQTNERANERSRWYDCYDSNVEWFKFIQVRAWS